MDEWKSPPTIEAVKAFRDQLISDWSSGEYNDSGLDEQQQDEEDVYFQKFQVSHPEGRPPVKTGSAPADCDAAIDSLVPPDILVKVRPRRTKEKYRKAADKLARLAKALLHAWRRQGRDPIRTLASDMVIRRYGVFRVLVDDQKWPLLPPELQGDDASLDALEDWEARYRQECPIVLEPRNPRHVRWSDDERGRKMVVVEYYQSTALLTRQALGMWPKAKKVLRGKDPQDPVQISDVWVGPYRCILIDEESVFPGSGVMPHGYFRIPYVVAPFRELHFDNPGQRFRGMLTNSRQLYPTESEALTAHMEMLFWNSYRTWLGWFPDGRDIVVKPGQYIPVNKNRGEYLEMMKGEVVPAELLQTVQVLDSYIDRNSTAQGPRNVSGTRSAQQIFAVQANRQEKLDSAKVSLQRALSEALSLGLMEIEMNLLKGGDSLTLPVPGRNREGEDLGEITVRASDIDGYWEGHEVIFDRRLDPAQLQQAQMMMAMSQNKWMPRMRSWELSGLTDSPQEWEDDLLSEAVESQDFMLEFAGLEKMKVRYGEDSPEYQALFQRIASQTGPTRQVGPGVPTGGSMQPNSMIGPQAGGGAPTGMEGNGLGAMVRSNSSGGGADNAPRGG